MNTQEPATREAGAQPIMLLAGRAVLRVGGKDAQTLLQGLLTCDVEKIAPGAPTCGALLAPQGKILHEAIIHREPSGDYLFDTDAALSAQFAKRLMFYRLRAQVDIAGGRTRLPSRSAPAGAGGELPSDLPQDPREGALGGRGIVAAEAGLAQAQDYDARRIACAVAELGRDFQSAEVFPHEANYDRLGCVDFAKGCYVGQEVVSRMQHRGTARKRFVPVAIEGTPPAAGSAVTAGGKPVGTMGSSAGKAGLALLRLDRLAAARREGQALECEGATLDATVPVWAASEGIAAGEDA